MYIHMPYMQSLAGISQPGELYTFNKCNRRIWLPKCKCRLYSHYAKWAYIPVPLAYIHQTQATTMSTNTLLPHVPKTNISPRLDIHGIYSIYLMDMYGGCKHIYMPYMKLLATSI